MITQTPLKPHLLVSSRPNQAKPATTEVNVLTGGNAAKAICYMAQSLKSLNFC